MYHDKTCITINTVYFDRDLPWISCFNTHIRGVFNSSVDFERDLYDSDMLKIEAIKRFSTRYCQNK